MTDIDELINKAEMLDADKHASHNGQGLPKCRCADCITMPKIITALKAHKALIERVGEMEKCPWVPIEDIPEEWKDGLDVDVIISISNEGSHRVVDCKYINKKWLRPTKRIGCYSPLEISDEYGTTKITYAMRPPRAPNKNPA